MVSNIPWSAPAPPAPAGLLNSPDLVTWLGYGLVLLLAALCMPGQVRESAKALWEPVKDFLARLHVSLLVGWCFTLRYLYGAFLSHLVTLGIACSDESTRKPCRGYFNGDTGLKKLIMT